MRILNRFLCLMSVLGLCAFAAPVFAAPPTPNQAQAPASQNQPISLFTFLDPETKQCIASGNCTLDDIVKTGAAFANLLTVLSGGFFFAAFIYGGARFLLSRGNPKEVDKGREAIMGAVIGMTIVLAAWTIVNYVVGSLIGKNV